MSAGDRFLLDAKVPIAFQRAGILDRLAVMAGTGRLHVVEEVWEEIVEKNLESEDARSRDQARHAKRVLEPSGLVRELILAGSPASAMLVALKGDAEATTHLGERASIALARDRDDLIFVTHDVKAAFVALNELGGRVILIPELVRRCNDVMKLGVCELRALELHLNQLLPTWWTSWSKAQGTPSPPVEEKPATAG